VSLNVQGSDSLYWKTGIDTSGLALGSNKAKGILVGLTSNISKMDVFAGLSVSAALAFAKISNEAYNFSKKFETSMKEVQTISDAVKNDFAGISQEIIDLSKIVPDRADQLAKAYYQIVSAGYDGAEALDMLAVSAKLAVAGVTDTFVAADAITSIMNAYGDAAGNAQNISDKLFMTVKLGKTKMEELGPSITTVTGLAAQAGMKFDDLMAIIAKGVKTLGTSEMMTGVRGMLIALTKQQDETKKKAKELGIEFNLTTLKTKGFSYFLKELKENTGGNVEILAELFPRVQGLSGLLAVATEAGGDFDEVLKQIANSAGSTEEAFRIMIATTDNQIALLKNIILAKMKPLGDDILAHVNKIAKSFNNAMTGYVAEFESYMSKLRAFESKGVDLDKYIKEYETLKEKQKLSSDEQDRLNGLISDIALIAPGAVTAYNDIGEAMAINTDHAKQLYQVELNMLRISKAGKKATENYINQIEILTNRLNGNFTAYSGWNKGVKESKQVLTELLAIQRAGTETISANSEEYKLLNSITQDYLKDLGMITDLSSDELGVISRRIIKYKTLDQAIERQNEVYIKMNNLQVVTKSNLDSYILGLSRYFDASKDVDTLTQDFVIHLGLEKDAAVELAKQMKELVTVKKELGKPLDDGGKGQIETIKEIGKAIENAFSGLNVDLPEFGKIDLDFSGGAASLSELMSVFGEHTEQLEAFRQAGIDTTSLLDNEWRNFTDNIKQYYGEDSATYIAAMNLKKDADNEYLEWKREKWIEEHEIAVEALGVLEAGYDTFLNSILDKEMTGKERREAIWDSMKSSFINLLGDMLKKYIADVLVRGAINKGAMLSDAATRAAISKTSQAKEIAASKITGAAIAAAYAPGAASASLASFGANSIPAMAGIMSTHALSKLLSTLFVVLNKGGEVQKLNKGGEIDWNKIVKLSGGGELNVGSDLNEDSVLTFLTKKEIVINRESSQHKDNRDIALGMNNDKDYIYKNFVPRNSGGPIERNTNFKIPSFPDFPSFPSSMNVSSNQLDKKLTALISVVKAQTMNQITRTNVPSVNINIESKLDMENFVTKFNKTQDRMKNRGYDG